MPTEKSKLFLHPIKLILYPRLLGELNKKIEIFEDKIARLDAIPTEIDADPRLLPILQGLKENLQDDARRNRDLYRKFEIH